MTDSEPVLTSLSLTHVEFRSNDLVARILAYVSLTPIFLIVSYATTIFWRRDLDVAVMLGGQLANEGINAVLKDFVYREARPGSVGKGHGMPSSHAQFMGFFFIFLNLYIYRRMNIQSTWLKHINCSLLLAITAAVCLSRTYLHYHTVPQTVAGLVIGLTVGFVYYVFYEFVLRTIVYPRVLSWRVSRWLLLRDPGGFEGNWWRAEYDLYRGATVARKVSKKG
ncbi:PAP2-domain-containing protein [Gonapodya prolifera JEL478]|uniref:Dolichyldiphosphatase n=1 Tax=Gonapodya prolifera (strain JEL478) TaxID=1344416 RepID=A0A139ADR1_GONPJ|nr:PAP2-domain-containing protein [Gonapodya prolifera JEL478]|eukprot:KXS14799.1 PAP2-domain-containing protein [Gonapodya prolifera JEL478]